MGGRHRRRRSWKGSSAWPRVGVGIACGTALAVAITVASPKTGELNLPTSTTTVAPRPETITTPRTPEPEVTTAEAPAPPPPPNEAPVTPTLATPPPLETSEPTRAPDQAPASELEPVPAPPAATPEPEPDPDSEPETQPAEDYPTTGFGGVKPFVAVVGHFIKILFGVAVSGVAHRGRASDHPLGYALDFMVGSNRSKGDKIAACVLSHEKAWHVNYVIWRQRINYGSGWEAMKDRGSVTENHYDHVHVSFDHGSLVLPLALTC